MLLFHYLLCVSCITRFWVPGVFFPVLACAALTTVLPQTVTRVPFVAVPALLPFLFCVVHTSVTGT